jgi:hypothetical protein
MYVHTNLFLIAYMDTYQQINTRYIFFKCILEGANFPTSVEVGSIDWVHFATKTANWVKVRRVSQSCSRKRRHCGVEKTRRMALVSSWLVGSLVELVCVILWR